MFLDISIQSISSVNIIKIEQVKSDDLVYYPNNLDDCNCDDVSTQYLEEINKLLDKIKIITNNIMLTFGYIPSVKLKCGEILDILYTLDDDRPICDTLKTICWELNNLSLYFINKALYYENKGNIVLYKIYLSISMHIWILIVQPINIIAQLLDCSWYNPSYTNYNN